jgi:hypothetical protein
MVMGEELEVGPNVEAVQRDLRAIAKRDPDLAESGMAQVALTLARGLDNDKNSLTSKAMATGQLRETLALLRELAPDEKKEDTVDQIGAKREQRRKRKAAASG